jgi:hypothetical protein
MTTNFLTYILKEKKFTNTIQQTLTIIMSFNFDISISQKLTIIFGK